MSKVYNGDCISHMLSDMAPESIDLLVTSVPFPAMYAYTDSESDLGNSEGLDSETKIHFSYWFRGVRRILKPGRVCVVHCMQIPLLKRSGREGLFDFRGFLIRLGQRAGLIYEYDWLVTKNQQAQAIRTHSHQLQFAGIEKDRANSRGALGDYLIKFVCPGDNAVPVDSPGDVSRNDWIDWADAAWTDIRETKTLNVRGSKSEGNTRHICPLQTDVIERLVRLYSNPGEVVFDPFMGIGSVGKVAASRGRNVYGCELREDWCARALREIELGEKSHTESQRTLFDAVEA